ncbi:MAG: Lrp/AsnC family transcriptional regulator [Pseudomonadota bacterium]
MQMDRADFTILRELANDARASQSDLAAAAGLSPTAVARRQRALEADGYIRGYQAMLNFERPGLGTTVVVRITLDSQRDEALRAFESRIANCPSVIRCLLMSGRDDYVVTVLARDIEDYERIHRTELSRLPGIARIESSFALRAIVDRSTPPVIFATKARDKKRD